MKNLITKKNVSWCFALIAALIMLQTLYFKFTAAPESVYIFSTLGLEPYGRILIGIAELIASILLVIPALRPFGAGLAFGLMSGALFSHFTLLGINVLGDKGYLFFLALVVCLSSMICLYLEKQKLLKILTSVFKRS